MCSLTYNSRAGAVSAASAVHHLLNLPNSKPTQFSQSCRAEEGWVRWRSAPRERGGSSPILTQPAGLSEWVLVSLVDSKHSFLVTTIKDTGKKTGNLDAFPVLDSKAPNFCNTVCGWCSSCLLFQMHWVFFFSCICLIVRWWGPSL